MGSVDYLREMARSLVAVRALKQFRVTKEREAARSWNILGIYWDAFWGIVIVAFTAEFLWKPYYRS